MNTSGAARLFAAEAARLAMTCRGTVLSLCATCCVLAWPAASLAQVVQGPEAKFDAGYVPGCAAIAHYWPSAITEDLIVDALSCSQGQQIFPSAVARASIRACHAEFNAQISAYLSVYRNPVLGNFVDWDANDSILAAFRKLRGMDTRGQVEQYIQERLREKGAAQNCLARYRIREIEGTALVPSTGKRVTAPPAPAPPPKAPPATPAPASRPLTPREPEGNATSAALDEVLDGAIPVAGQPATPPKPVKPRPVPPTLEVRTNTGTRCMTLKLENFRVDEYGNASHDFVLTNNCPTTQLVVAEVSSTGWPTMFNVPGIVGSGTHRNWNHKTLPPNLGFTPVLWNSWDYIVGPREVLRGFGIARSGDRLVAWLASCDAYRDGYYEMMFRAGPYLGADPRVACEHNIPGAPR